MKKKSISVYVLLLVVMATKCFAWGEESPEEFISGPDAKGMPPQVRALHGGAPLGFIGDVLRPAVIDLSVKPLYAAAHAVSVLFLLTVRGIGEVFQWVGPTWEVQPRREHKFGEHREIIYSPEMSFQQYQLWN